MGLLCIGDVVVTPDGMGDVIDMNARKSVILVELEAAPQLTVKMRWYPMDNVTLVEDMPDPTDLVEIEAYLEGRWKKPANKPLPDAATIACCTCSCGRKGNCGNMSSNGFHTPMNSSCNCAPLYCHCVGGDWNG